MSSDAPPVAAKKQLSFREIVEKSAASAARGGIAGACAMGANVAALMWIRTTVRNLSAFFYISSMSVLLFWVLPIIMSRPNDLIVLHFFIGKLSI